MKMCKKVGMILLTVSIIVCMVLGGCTPQESENPVSSPTPEDNMYDPRTSDEYKLYSAWQMYYMGSTLKTNLADRIVTDDGDYPYMHYAVGEEYDGNAPYFQWNTTNLGFELKDYPIVQIYYKTNGQVGATGSSVVTNLVNNVLPEEAEMLTADEQWHTATVDLTAMADEEGWFYNQGEVSNVIYRIAPMGTAAEEGDYFDISYIGFFKTVEQAEAFDLEQQKEYLTTDCAEELFYEEATQEVVDKQMALIDEKRDAIVNSPNMSQEEIDEILGDFGRAYYVSSVNGDDNNDGFSPETPVKTLEKVNELCDTYRAGVGSIVFLERGSVWRNGITIRDGIVYTAYGEGEKPVITTAVDGANPDLWLETEWENVWKFDYNFGDINSDVGNIVFNDGEAWTIKIMPDGTGKSVRYGLEFNGIESFEAGGGELVNAGSLQNNLELYHDWEDGHIYLYCDYGNPGEYFDSVDICMRRAAVNKEDALAITLDNISFKYIGECGVALFGCYDFHVQNCTLEWIGGAVQGLDANGAAFRFGNGIQNWADCDGFYVTNCYFTHNYDSCVTSQFTDSSEDRVVKMNNIEFGNNVMEYAVTNYELWNWSGYGWTDGSTEQLSQLQRNSIENAWVHDNYARYMGYGLGYHGDTLNGYFWEGAFFWFQRYYNVIVENNVSMFTSSFGISSRRMGGTEEEGVVFRNNSYILSRDKNYYSKSVENFNGTGGYYYTPYTERGLQYLVLNGVEVGTKFYYYDGWWTEDEENGIFYIMDD